MLAAFYDGIEKINVRETTPPDLPPGGAILRIKSTAICGTDVRTFHHGSSFCEPPWIIGHEVAGEVVEVGHGVTSIGRGDRVTVAAGVPCGTCHACTKGWKHLCSNVKAHGFHHPGGFAEFMAVDAQAVKQNALNRIEDKISYDQAALTEPLSCVINGQDLVNVSPGDTVAIIGAGPIGCMHVEVARSRGAAKIIHIEMNKQRLEAAQTFGADHYVDASKENAVERVMELTEKQGADVVIAACPAKEAQSDAVQMAALRGRVSFFGGLPKSDPIAPINGNTIHYKELGVFGAFASSPAQNKEALDLITSGAIKSDAIITHRLPLKQISEGFRLMDSGEALKVVINP